MDRGRALKIIPLVLGLIMPMPPALAAEPPAAIDGTTESSFRLTHARVVGQLSLDDRYRLALAELVMLSNYHCSQPRPSPNDDFVVRLLGGLVDLTSCRRKLHGMTFADVMTHAYPDEAQVPTGQ